MSEQELLVVIFAPATVGLVVMASRRLPVGLYLAIALTVIAAALMGFPGYLLETDTSLLGSLLLAALFLAMPTLAAFGCGRLTAVHLGGASVFAVSSTAFLFGLGVASGLVGLLGLVKL